MPRATIFSAVSVVLLLVAMVFLILGMVALPVSSSLKLASTQDYTYGIFGYCKGGTCPKALYPVSFGDIDTDQNWLLAADTRNTLAQTFIVAPIAAGITFFSIVLTVVSLFISSAPVKIFSLVFGVISFVATTLVAIMVVLVFYPNTAWTGWLYIASAALTLIAVPCLLLSIKVVDADDDSDEESENKDAYGNVTQSSFSGGPLLNKSLDQKYQFSGPHINAYTTDEMSSISKDYSYRGAATGTGYNLAKNDSHSSLLNSNPHLANDITKPNSIPAPSSRNNSDASFFDDAVSLNQGPSTPISSKQKMAPNFIPNVAIPQNNSGYKPLNNLPYPKSERGPATYNPQAGRGGYTGAALGVFDHHPNVEGHQPFTELDDDLPDRDSLLPSRQIDSDEDSDFTSVSQRPPNVMYQAPPPQPQFQQRPPQLYQQLYQQQYPNVSNYQPPIQQNTVPSQPSSYYGSESASYNPQYQLSGYQQVPFQSAPYQQPRYVQPQPQHRPQPRGPTVADSILNNNPDFAVGSGQKKFVPPAKRYANPTKPSPRPRNASRDGPYGML